VSDISYRLASVQDAPALAAFAAGSFTATFGHLYPPEDLASFLAKNYAEPVTREEIEDAAYRYWLAEREDAIVGYSMAGPLGLPVGHASSDRELYRLYVAEAVKGAGVADALLRLALDWARIEGAANLWLSVWEDNARAQNFYKRYGFEHMGEHKFMVGRVADRDFIWRLTLSA
jgi:ribosomal protein S18 acetylase RimI-like enzyme